MYDTDTQAGWAQISENGEPHAGVEMAATDTDACGLLFCFLFVFKRCVIFAIIRIRNLDKHHQVLYAFYALIRLYSHMSDRHSVWYVVSQLPPPASAAPLSASLSQATLPASPPRRAAPSPEGTGSGALLFFSTAKRKPQLVGTGPLFVLLISSTDLRL